MRGTTLTIARTTLSEFRVVRKAGAQLLNLLVHTCLGHAVVAGSARQPAQYLDDPSSDGPELVLPKAAGCRRRRAETDARGNRRFLRVERDPILVASDPGSFEAPLGILAGDPQRPQIHQHQVRIGPTGDDLEPRCRESLGERLGVL